MNIKKIKNLLEKSFKIYFSRNIVLLCISISVLLFTSFFILKTIKNNKFSHILDNDNWIYPIFNDNYNNNDNPTLKQPLKTLTEEGFKYCKALSYDERLSFLNMNDYSIEDRLKVFLGDDINKVGLIYYDINSKNKISINSHKEFIAASTYKLTLNLLVYHLASLGQLDLNESIKFIDEDYADGTGILCDLDYIGSYSIQELLDLSLIYSDNIATDMVSRHLGGKANVRSEVYKLLNITYDSTENLITPNIEFAILNYIYDKKYNYNYDHMLDTLTKTTFNDRLDKYIPNEEVAHKIGTYFEYIHDVGIIFDNSPHMLIIYTENVEDAEEKIAQISKAFYNTPGV